MMENSSNKRSVSASGTPASRRPIWGFLLRVGILAALDAALVNAAILAGLFVRLFFDNQMLYWNSYFAVFLRDILLFTGFAILVNLAFGLYSTLWRYAGVTEVVKLGLPAVLVPAARLAWDIGSGSRLPIAAYAVGALVYLTGMMVVRLGYRAGRRLRITASQLKRKSRPRTLIVGAGEAGSILLHAMAESPNRQGRICALIDDDPKKYRLRLHGARVEGDRNAIPVVVKRHRIERILMAIPSARQEDFRDILRICLSTGCEVFKVMPEDLLHVQSVHGDFSLQASLRVSAIQPEDLLGRDPVWIDSKAAESLLRDRTVLITGGAGSIGSEIARQVADFSPKRLIVFDYNENDVYRLSLEMALRHPSLDFVVVIGSVRDKEKISSTFAFHRPDVVFHAAAHKHVPLMENDPEEAVKNNIFGTYNAALCAASYGASRFILISTDKAVNPTNVMGASKRMCESIVKGMAENSEQVRATAPDAEPTRFAAVRFGNVLGSNGSVIPLFKRQIAQGGPVTVTHPEMTRYFMTIPEAARLVIEAGAMAEGGEIFVLDMGTPIRIDELARRMIQMAGLVVDKDIRIAYVGLRPGEKLNEELYMDGEQTLPTHHPKITRVCDDGLTYEALEASLGVLYEALDSGLDIRETLRRVVPTFRPDPAPTVTEEV